MITKLKTTGTLAVALVSVLLLSACGGQNNETTTGADGKVQLAGSVVADGSSTVAPLAEAVADMYRQAQAKVNVTVATSGTGGGFKKFCAGETDISNASRPIKAEEASECAAKGITFTEIVVANDGLSVVVNPKNSFAKCLTVAQLKTLWSPESEGKVTTWNAVDASFPDTKISLFGAGTDSGTFDYFTEAITGTKGAIRADYSPSEDDNITVQGVAGDKGSVGFLGLSYVEQNLKSLKAVAVDGGSGCVEPSAETVKDGTYKPLSRPLFIYVNKASFADKPQVKDFVKYFVAHEADASEAALFISLTDEQKKKGEAELASLG